MLGIKRKQLVRMTLPKRHWRDWTTLFESREWTARIEPVAFEGRPLAEWLRASVSITLGSQFVAVGSASGIRGYPSPHIFVVILSESHELGQRVIERLSEAGCQRIS